MIIYLAGGMSVTNVKGRERYLSEKMSTWHRLFSFYHLIYLERSEILKIKEDANNKNNAGEGADGGQTRAGG
jgi:hypothetical protein